jgi:hypothetical protein
VSDNIYASLAHCQKACKTFQDSGESRRLIQRGDAHKLASWEIGPAFKVNGIIMRIAVRYLRVIIKMAYNTRFFVVSLPFKTSNQEELSIYLGFFLSLFIMSCVEKVTC